MFFAIMLLATSCGRQHKAKGTVEDFLKENLVDAANLGYADCENVDSTRYIMSSSIEAMRKNAKSDKRFKSNIKYVEFNSKKMLISARVTYAVGTDKFTETFYIDDKFKGVIAFKTSR